MRPRTRTIAARVGVQGPNNQRVGAQVMEPDIRTFRGLRDGEQSGTAWRQGGARIKSRARSHDNAGEVGRRAAEEESD